MEPRFKPNTYRWYNAPPDSPLGITVQFVCAGLSEIVLAELGPKKKDSDKDKENSKKGEGKEKAKGLLYDGDKKDR